MADVFHQRSVKKSRKARQCSWCAEIINVGEPYESYGWRDRGDSGYVYIHPECLAACNQAASDNNGWVEFSPGYFKRGSTEC